jgi:hypothetical protein
MPLTIPGVSARNESKEILQTARQTPVLQILMGTLLRFAFEVDEN